MELMAYSADANVREVMDSPAEMVEGICNFIPIPAEPPAMRKTLPVWSAMSFSVHAGEGGNISAHDAAI